MTIWAHMSAYWQPVCQRRGRLHTQGISTALSLHLLPFAALCEVLIWANLQFKTTFFFFEKNIFSPHEYRIWEAGFINRTEQRGGSVLWIAYPWLCHTWEQWRRAARLPLDWRGKKTILGNYPCSKTMAHLLLTEILRGKWNM